MNKFAVPAQEFNSMLFITWTYAIPTKSHIVRSAHNRIQWKFNAKEKWMHFLLPKMGSFVSFRKMAKNIFTFSLNHRFNLTRERENYYHRLENSILIANLENNSIKNLSDWRQQWKIREKKDDDVFVIEVMPKIHSPSSWQTTTTTITA